MDKEILAEMPEWFRIIRKEWRNMRVALRSRRQKNDRRTQDRDRLEEV